MGIIACGVNHKTADLAIREKLAVGVTQVPGFLANLLGQSAIEEVVVLSTCNRVEVYAVSDDVQAVKEAFLRYGQIPMGALDACWYQMHDEAAIEHVMKVACGLDSMVLGEPQILGQMKVAVAMANEYQGIGSQLHGLFRHVFQLAKEVRATTQIGACPMSVASIATRLAEREFPVFSEMSVLLVGAGDTMRLVAKYLKQAGVKQVTVASRRLEKAAEVAAICEGRAMTIGQMADHLPEADIVMTATASEVPILGKGCVESALAQRDNKPMLLIDMAVPRDIEPEVKTLDNVSLYTIDDLKSLAQEGVKVREHAALQAGKSVQIFVGRYLAWLREQESSGMIRAFRDHVGEIRKEELTKALRLLSQGAEPSVVLERLANGLVNKLMHQPSVQMRQASAQGREEVFDLVQELFDIKSAP